MVFSSLFYIYLSKRSNLFHFVTLYDKLFGQYFIAYFKWGVLCSKADCKLSIHSF